MHAHWNKTKFSDLLETVNVVVQKLYDEHSIIREQYDELCKRYDSLSRIRKFFDEDIRHEVYVMSWQVNDALQRYNSAQQLCKNIMFAIEESAISLELSAKDIAFLENYK